MQVKFDLVNIFRTVLENVEINENHPQYVVLTKIHGVDKLFGVCLGRALRSVCRQVVALSPCAVRLIALLVLPCAGCAATLG